jgi:SlyX protein
MESRLVDIELRFMKLERFTQELSDVVASQGRSIDGLTLELQRLRALLSREDREDGESRESEKPPHY